MDDMIQAQRGLTVAIAASDDAHRLAARLREAAQRGEPITLTGCWTSEHAARAIHALLTREFAGQPISVRDAFEAAVEPPTRGLIVGISHEVGTAATLIRVGATAG